MKLFLILFTFDVNKFFVCKVWRQFQCKEKWNYWFSILFWLVELIAQEFQKQKRRSISSESAGSAHSKTSCCYESFGVKFKRRRLFYNENPVVHCINATTFFSFQPRWKCNRGQWNWIAKILFKTVFNFKVTSSESMSLYFCCCKLELLVNL